MLVLQRLVAGLVPRCDEVTNELLHLKPGALTILQREGTGGSLDTAVMFSMSSMLLWTT